MKKILITGSDSYIGTSVEKYLNSWENKYAIETIDMIDGTWREKDFFGYDVVFHVAGIAHSDTTKISSEQEEKYYSVNTNLANVIGNLVNRTIGMVNKYFDGVVGNKNVVRF